MSTLIQLVLDETGSMSGVEDATISGVNEFLATQRKTPGALFGLTTFNSEKLNFTDIKPIEEAADLTRETYQPNNLTPLYDAVGKSIRHVEDALKKMTEQPEQVLIAVMTDGYENASREFDHTGIRNLVDEKQKAEKAWQFVFLGANVDEWALANKIGGMNMASNAVAFAVTPAGIGNAMCNLTNSTTSYRSSGRRMTSNFWSGSTEDEV
jgi:uncharacterized protein YegL